MSYLKVFSAALWSLTLISLSACNDSAVTAEGAIDYCQTEDMLLTGLAGSIEGNGLFVLSDGSNFSYTRDGTLCVDQQGSIRHPSGNVYQFYKIDNEPLFSSQLYPAQVRIYSDGGMPLDGLFVSRNGMVYASYADDTTREVGQVALAKFNSPQALKSEPQHLCRESVASGVPQYSFPTKQGLGGIVSSPSQGAMVCSEGSLFFDQLLSVNGEGLLRLDDNGETFYGDTIELATDKQGYLMDPNGYRVTGYPYQEDYMVEQLQSLRLPMDLSQPRATEKIAVTLNLNAQVISLDPLSQVFYRHDPSSYHYSMKFIIFDSLGAQHDMWLYFRKILSIPNTWEVYNSLVSQEVIPLGLASGDPALLRFDVNGQLASAFPNQAGKIQYSSFTLDGGGGEIQLEIDFEDSTQYAAEFNYSSLTQNGYPAGHLRSIAISNDGVLSGEFQSELSPNIDDQLAIDILPPQATEEIKLDLNLDAESLPFSPVDTVFSHTDPTTYHYATDLTVYDSLGHEHVLTVYFRTVDIVPHYWEVYSYLDGHEVVPWRQASGDPVIVSFDTGGRFLYASASLPQDSRVYYQSIMGFSSDSAPISLIIDFNSSTQYAYPFTVNEALQDGRPARVPDEGELPPFIESVPLEMFYTVPLYQLPLATFSNAEALQYMDNGLYQETPGSGSALLGLPSTQGNGKLHFVHLSEP